MREAIAYPRRRDGWKKRVRIGGILYLFAFLVVPLLLIEGYLYRVLGATIRGDERVPEWTDWRALLTDGIKMYLIQFGYFLVPVVVLLLGFVSGSTVFISFGLILTAGAGYVLPAGLANFAHTGSFSAAFDIETVRRAVFTRAYFVPILLAVLVGVTLTGIGLLLSVLLVGVFVLFYSDAVVYHLMGRAFAAGLDL